MLELDAGQLDRLQRVRDDEVIERVLLEVRREAPAWLERRGLLPAIRQLGELRATALELGIEEPGTIERFLLHGLAFPLSRTRRRFSHTCAGRWRTARNNASRTTNGSSSFAWPARNGARTKPRGDRHERHRRAFPTAAPHGSAAALRTTRAAPAALADAGAAPAAATGPRRAAQAGTASDAGAADPAQDRDRHAEPRPDPGSRARLQQEPGPRQGLRGVPAVPGRNGHRQ